MLSLLLAAVVCNVNFAGPWDRGAWRNVRQANWDRGTPFVQTEGGLVNWSDPKWSDEEIFAKHQTDVCSAMVLTNRFAGEMSFVTKTSFDHRMAPAVVIAAGLGKDAKGRDALGDFFEIVLFDEGLNVWKHVWENGRERVSKVAYLTARYEPKEPYALTVTMRPVKRRGGDSLDIRVSCDGHTLGFRDETFPHEYYAGILGAEGRCRFHSFAAATDVDEIALDERPQYLRTIRVNQVGYAANAPKLAEVPAAFPFKTFTVQTMTPAVTWVDVMTGEFSAPKGLYKYADFSSVTNPGDYRIVCGNAPRIAGNIRDRVGTHSSNWFKVHDGVYDHLQRMLFGFYTWQRCGSTKGWPGVCHQDRVPLVGTDRTLDMRGGYHQSDDLRCWADDTARAVWQLFCWAEKAKFAWDDGAIAEELRWGADYFAKLVGEKGYAWDCQFEPIGWGPRNYYATPAPMCAQFCVLHVLCRAARYFKTRDAAFAAKCLAKAERLMRELEENPFFAKPYVPPVKIPAGSQPADFYKSAYRGMPDIDAAFVSAAVELYEASEKSLYRGKVDAYGETMLKTYAKLDYSGCCGIGDFMRFAPFRAYNLTGDGRYRALLRKQCDDYIRDTWNLQTNRGTLLPIAKGVVLMEGYRIFGDRDCLVAAQKGLDWDLGVNRFEQSFVNGIGRNTQPHEAWGQFYPSTPYIPGAVVHIMDGEYNLPNAGILLLLAQRLNALPSVAEKASPVGMFDGVVASNGREFISPERFEGTDSERIEKALAEAARRDAHDVWITGGRTWTLDRAIVVPEKMWFIIDGSDLVLKEGVRDNVIRSAPGAKDVNVIGFGFRKCEIRGCDGIPAVEFDGVDGFNLANLAFPASRPCAVRLSGKCANGNVRLLRFRQPEGSTGLDLSPECTNVTVNYLYGLKPTADEEAAVRAVAEKPTAELPPLVPAPRKFVRTKGAYRAPDAYVTRDWIAFSRDASLKPEGYRLSVAADGVRVAAADEAGERHAMATLRQLGDEKPRFANADAMTAGDRGAALILPCCEIEDWPAYRWRGIQLDEGRHFFGKETVKHVLDQMADHKLNVFHWHLTEDQGWRIAIDRYPRLATHASVRPSSPEVRSVGNSQNGEKYGPYFYTKDEIREIVAYAAARGITVVPEVEFPGHIRAALAAYPEYSCRGEKCPKALSCIWGVEDDVLCVGNDEALAFIENILDEVVELFPGKYFHIGGDECPTVRWKECPKCRARAKALGIPVEKLQGWITSRFTKYLEKKGRHVIGWDEIASCDIPVSARVMNWRGAEHGIPAAKKGHDIVMCSGVCYMNAAPGVANDPFAPLSKPGSGATIEKVYAFDPAGEFPSDLKGRVIGSQACFWSEYLRSRYDLDWYMWPRAAALAEVLWTDPTDRDFAAVSERFAAHRARLVKKGINASTLK